MLYRKATIKDIPAIIAMLAADILGRQREEYSEPLPSSYYEAFARIDSDANQELIVVENNEKEIIGTFQLTFIPYLNYRGGIRAQVESVHVREDQRGKGLGKQLFEWAIHRAREKGAHILQLTSDKRRPDAIRFYQKLGFTASHEGLKMHLK